MSALTDKKKLVLNALLAGFWVALALFVDTKSFTADALLAAGATGLRYAVGLILAGFGKPVPVDK